MKMRYCLYIEEELQEWIRQKAKEEDRTITTTVERIIREAQQRTYAEENQETYRGR